MRSSVSVAKINGMSANDLPIQTMMKSGGRALAFAAALLLTGVGLVGCGDEEAAEPKGATSEAPAETSEDQQTTDTDSAPQGEPVPADWPAQFLLPDGTITLVLELGSGYQLVIEGVDDDAAQDLITQMTDQGMESRGVVDLGNGEWAAEVSDGEWSAAYAYATGGAGLPNVAVTLTPAV